MTKNTVIAKNILALAKEKGLSRYAIAKGADLTNTVVYRACDPDGTEEPSVSTVIKLANFFGVSTDRILLAQHGGSHARTVAKAERKNPDRERRDNHSRPRRRRVSAARN